MIFVVFWVLCSTLIVVIAMPVMADTHPSARWVFTEFRNTTGWQNSGLTFLLGMLQAGWSLVSITRYHIQSAVVFMLDYIDWI